MAIAILAGNEDGYVVLLLNVTYEFLYTSMAHKIIPKMTSTFHVCLIELSLLIQTFCIPLVVLKLFRDFNRNTMSAHTVLSFLLLSKVKHGVL